MRAKRFRPHGAYIKRASAIGAFVPELTKRAFQKYGFSTATILTDWPAIVGSNLAATTRPERLKWPRNNSIHNDLEDHADQRRGATLVLRVEPSHALEVHYQHAVIKDRINSYFGYCAVSEIRVLQAPISRNSSFSSVITKNNTIGAGAISSTQQRSKDSQETKAVDPLLDALSQLQHNIISRNRAHKHAP